jgi:hypothetical protein
VRSRKAKIFILLCFFLLIALLPGSWAAGETFRSTSSSALENRISWIGSGEEIEVQVTGVSPELLHRLSEQNWGEEKWQQLLAVYVVQKTIRDEIALPPVSGHYKVYDERIQFRPRFPLTSGLKYNAVFNPNRIPKAKQGQKVISSSFELPARPAESSSYVTEIFPTAETVPENLLKFYLHFSGPMSGGRIYDHIELLNEGGVPVELPFLEIDEELWNKEMTRLTLFLDPGRIKRGVRPLEEVGPSLVEGQRYTLVIKPTWKDAAGNPLKASFKKILKVGPVDRDAIDPNKWQIKTPNAGTREGLKVAFQEPLDHALALRMIHFLDSSGNQLRGLSETGPEEQSLVFKPENQWVRGTYQMAVESVIEDLAGNNIGKPFEVDVFDKVQKQIGQDVITIPFEVR